MSTQGKKSRRWINIDEELLKSFFSHPVDAITTQEVNEVRKVIGIVLNTYFSKWYAYYDDLFSWVLSALLEKHGIYNPEYRAYTFIYTIARNEAGNKIAKHFKEVLLEEYPDVESTVIHESRTEGVRAFLPYLSGEKKYGMIGVPQDMVLPILKFAAHGKNPRKEQVLDEVNEVLIQLNYV